MKALWVNTILGLYEEMFNPTDASLEERGIVGSFYNATTDFWADILCDERVAMVLSLLEKDIAKGSTLPIQFHCVCGNSQLFRKKLTEAVKRLTQENISQCEFFSMIENISIYCSIYSYYLSSPFVLSIQEGFVLKEVSSQDIIDNCLRTNKNPYWAFINQKILPKILVYRPDVVFFNGKLGYFSLALSLLIKDYLPNVHISITRHASEYYSLNKIDSYLIKNKKLFTVIDSIILSSFVETEQLLLKSIKEDLSMDLIPNLIFKSLNGTIRKTEITRKTNINEIVCRTRTYIPATTAQKDFPNGVVDIHYSPTEACFWNRCSFCGINKKYSEYTLTSICQSKRLKNLLNVIKHSYYLWFIDEAIKPDVLKQIAACFIDNEIKVKWQARTRIDKALLDDDLPSLLAKAGLVELRLGLESASYSVLREMQKFDDNFSLDLVRKIVCKYQENKISIHFPMIIGFPGETKYDRQKTYEFLGELKTDYSSISFNINLLNLDVSSKLFCDWTNYSISSIMFPCLPEHYIGNICDWDSPIKESETLLDLERNSFMKEWLYPWLPSNAITQPVILYRLSENARYTLLWKDHGDSYLIKTFVLQDKLLLSPNTVIVAKDDENIIAYSFSSHHYIEGNLYLKAILEEFNRPVSSITAIKRLESKDPHIYLRNELIPIFEKMFLDGILEKVDTDLKATVQKRSLDTRNFYDKTYFIGNASYRTEKDAEMLSLLKHIKKGTVLELGIGEGQNVDSILAEGFAVHGIDISPIAVTKLQEKHQGNNVILDLKDITTVELKKESYSLINATMVLSHLTYYSQNRIAQQIVDALLPNGYFCFLDLTEEDPMCYGTNYIRYGRSPFSEKRIRDLFSSLKTCKIRSFIQYDEHREVYNGYFSLVRYIGQK